MVDGVGNDKEDLSLRSERKQGLTRANSFESPPPWAVAMVKL